MIQSENPGYASNAESWLSDYEESETEDLFTSLWKQIRPLYQQLHAYIRMLLRLKYGQDVVSEKGPIPAHLLGNIWAHTWSDLEKFTKPFPDKPEVDITNALTTQNYTVLRMFQLSDEFFQSINMSAMPESFWKNSVVVKPDDDRDLVCHPSAWDFYDGKDFRIKQCTAVDSSFFTTTHHEMGHIQYYIQYKDQPQVFKAGANPGFHEAVGDTIGLSVMTPKHLRVIGLLEEGEDDEETQINQLYNMSLDRIAFLPFGYLLDLFRYGVFRGTTTPDDYNCHFWAFREAIQGVEPPVPRSDDQDFDPAAKYHVSADVEYARYYISYIIQFQFQQALCELAGEYGGDSNATLASCDIYKSAAAGNALSNMLKLGSSKPWPDAMEALTGQRKMDASGVLEYFDPLYQWLKQENTSERSVRRLGTKHCRIKQCSSLTSSFFITTHHEMGHIQYYMHYSDQPEIFKGSANPGFQEAVGDTIALSVATPKHLRVVGLLEEGEDDEETEINQLYQMGLDRIVFLPFGYLLDLFRYGVFRGTTTPDDYNCHFWAFREALQGVEPPVARSDEQDFDPAAKYHISADVEYARYYISYIIQFQFQQALCELAGEYGGDSNATLASCDIYKSAAAGNALSNMLKLGTSKPWPDAMEALTGQRNMNASGVLEYFDPLYQWLQAENTKNGEYIGWEPSTVEYCTKSQKARRQSSGFDDNLAKVSGTS